MHAFTLIQSQWFRVSIYLELEDDKSLSGFFKHIEFLLYEVPIVVLSILCMVKTIECFSLNSFNSVLLIKILLYKT